MLSMTSSRAGDIDYGALLLGMLVTQDVQLGLFIAILPTLIQAGAGAHARYGFCRALVHSLFFWLQIICLSKYSSALFPKDMGLVQLRLSIVTAVTLLGSGPAPWLWAITLFPPF